MTAPAAERVGRPDTPPPRARPGRALVATAFAVVALAHVALVTEGTGRLAVTEPRGESFDSLARSLLRGRVDVDPAAIAWEGFQVGDRTVIYFGPFPALLRIVPNALAPGMYGRWTRISCLVGGLLAVVAGARIVRRALERRTGRPADPRLVAAAVVALGLGSPIAFLVSNPIIYHEAIAWGLCSSLWGVSLARDLLDPEAPAVRSVAALSAAFAAALLSRITFGPSLGLVLAVLLPAVLRRELGGLTGRHARRRAAALLLATAPALLGAAMQLWYNQARFGTPWKTIDHSRYWLKPDLFGGVFNPLRLRTSLPAYFGAQAALRAEPPYLEPRTVRYVDPALFMNWRDQTFSLSLGSPWLVLSGLAGVAVLARRRGPALEAAVALAFAAQALLMVSFYFVTQRYQCEFLPLGLFLLASFLRHAGGGAGEPRGLRAGAAALVPLSALTTLLSTLSWNLVYNGDAPPEYKERLARAISRPPRMAPWHGPRVPLGDLPGRVVYASADPPRRDRGFTGGPLRLRGITYPHGLALHADSVLALQLPPRSVAVQALLGLPDETNRYWTADVVFEALDGEGRLLFRSQPFRNADRPLPVRIRVEGSRGLVLAVRTGDGRIDRDDVGVWAAGEVLLAPPPAP